MSLYNILRSLILPLQEIDKFIPEEGTVIDLGCGQGIIASFLANKKKRNVIGVDLNAKRLPKSNTKNLKFIHADIRKYNVKNANGIVVSDVLHHIIPKDQHAIIKNITKNLKKEGVLIIKEIDTGELIRSRLSRFWDFVFYPKEKIYFKNAKDLKNELESFGLKVKVKKASSLFPGSTNLFICRK